MDIYNYISTHEKLLNQIPGFILLVDLNSRFAWANTKVIKLFGFKSLNEMQGKCYSNIKCKACENAEISKANDKLIFNQHENVSFLCYEQYADDWQLHVAEKSLLVDDEEKPIGLISSWTDITNSALMDISRFITNSQKPFNKENSNQFSFVIKTQLYNGYLLSQRQLECLFFLLRGKSDKQIAGILGLSPRTVESYIQEIKYKMQCLTRSQIIEKSFNEGLFNVFPKSFLQKSRIDF